MNMKYLKPGTSEAGVRQRLLTPSRWKGYRVCVQHGLSVVLSNRRRRQLRCFRLYTNHMDWRSRRRRFGLPSRIGNRLMLAS